MASPATAGVGLVQQRVLTAPRRGATYVRAEHNGYAIPFPEPAARLDRFEKQVAVIGAGWS